MSLSAWLRPRQESPDADSRASGAGSTTNANKASGANVEKLRKYFQLAKVPLAAMRSEKYILCLDAWRVTCARVGPSCSRSELRNQHMRMGGAAHQHVRLSNVLLRSPNVVINKSGGVMRPVSF